MKTPQVEALVGMTPLGIATRAETTTVVAETLRAGDVIMPPPRELRLWMRNRLQEKNLPENALHMTITSIDEAMADKGGRWMIVHCDQTKEWVGDGKIFAFNFKVRPSTDWELVRRAADVESDLIHSILETPLSDDALLDHAVIRAYQAAQEQFARDGRQDCGSCGGAMLQFDMRRAIAKRAVDRKLCSPDGFVHLSLPDGVRTQHASVSEAQVREFRDIIAAHYPDAFKKFWTYAD